MSVLLFWIRWDIRVSLDIRGLSLKCDWLDHDRFVTISSLFRTSSCEFYSFDVDEINLLMMRGLGN